MYFADAGLVWLEGLKSDRVGAVVAGAEGGTSVRTEAKTAALAQGLAPTGSQRPLPRSLVWG